MVTMVKALLVTSAMLLTVALLTINNTIINIGFARFCIAPDSYFGKVTLHLIELGKLKILTDNNKTDVAKGQKVMANLTNTLCKPGETMNLFGNQSSTPTTNLTTTNMTAPNTAGNVTASHPFASLIAAVSPDNSNQFLHNQFKVDMFGFETNDTMICLTGLRPNGCTYTLSNGQWSPNLFGSNRFLFVGTLKATSGMASNFYDVRASLTRNSENTTSYGHDVISLTGMMSFGNGVPDYNVFSTFDNTNSTLRIGGIPYVPYTP